MMSQVRKLSYRTSYMLKVMGMTVTIGLRLTMIK